MQVTLKKRSRAERDQYVAHLRAALGDEVDGLTVEAVGENEVRLTGDEHIIDRWAGKAK
jgi:hypothetical protein